VAVVETTSGFAGLAGSIVFNLKATSSGDVSPLLGPLLSFAAIGAQLLYAAPSHLVCIISGDRQYGCE
jgi:hypothetical protein